MLAALYKWHVRLARVAGLVILLWAASGLLHPVMTFMNVRAATFMPPAQNVSLAGVQPFSGDAAGMRYMTLDGRTVLQITEGERRHYREARTGAAIDENADRDYAVTLARHYTGESVAAVKEATLITGFDLFYAPVNHLLPVWRVSFERPDGLSVYVETETDRVATVNNSLKAALLAVFQTVHTMSFLNRAEPSRLVIVTLLISSAAAMAMTGIGLVFLLRRPKMPRGVRGTHRLLALMVWIPVLVFSVSGVFHLLVNGGKAVSAAPPPLLHAESVPDGESYRDIRLVKGSDGALWRVETAERRTLFADAMTGAIIPLREEEYALDVAGVTPEDMVSVTKVETFTNEYGFGNRILPVWRVERKSDRVLSFADTATGRIIVTVTPVGKAELWSFNTLHKGGFLNGLGVAWRDSLLMACAGSIIIAAACGLILLLRRKR